MTTYNEFGEIIRDGKETISSEEKFPTFTPPKDSSELKAKLEVDFGKKGEKILNTGKYDYKGTEYDLSTLTNLSERLASEISEGRDDSDYSMEVLTIAIQMRKKALEAILQDTQRTPKKEEELTTLIDTQMDLGKKGIILSPSQVTQDPKKADIYIKALQEELEKQKEIDRAKAQEASEKLPNIRG